MSRSAVLMVVLAVGLTGTPATADGDSTAVSVTAPADATAGGVLSVAGEVVYGADVVVVAEGEPDAGALADALGADLVRAVITSDPATPSELELALEVTNLPPPLGGTPEAVIYDWSVEVDGKVPFGNERTSVVWRRTNHTDPTFTHTLSTGPAVEVMGCEGSSCWYYVGGTLRGEFDGDANRISARVPLAWLQAKPGSVVVAGVNGVLTYPGTGAYWLPEGAFDQLWPGAYTVPVREVDLALVAAGAPDPEQFDVSVQPGGFGAAGSFQAQLPTAGLAPGDYEVVARACWGTNCATARTPVRLG